MKKSLKNNKLLFSLIGSATLVAPFLLAISCEKKENKENDANKKEEVDKNYTDAAFKKDVAEFSTKLEDIFDVSFTKFFLGKKENVYASELQSQPSFLELSFKDKNFNKKIDVRVDGINVESRSNITGHAKVIVELSNKATKTKEVKIFDLDGLATNPNNTDHSGNRPSNYTPSSLKKEELEKYITLSQEERFKIDNEKHIKGLKDYLAFAAGIKEWESLRKDLKAKPDKISEFNEKAKKLGQDTFENQAYKGFTLPSYKSDGSGEVDGLDILPGQEMPKRPSEIDVIGKSNPDGSIGLARKIVNEHYLDIAKQTYSIRLTNLRDWKNEIAKNEADIKYLKENIGEFDKLKKDKLEQLQKDRKAVEDEFNKKIDSLDTTLKKKETERRDKALADYDASIKHYESLDNDKYIEFLKKQIDEFKQKAENNKKEKREFIPENGTMWILDFQLDNDGYPTKWYFGTNSHVARALTNNLQSFSITKVSDELKVGSPLRLSWLDDNIHTYGFDEKSKDAIKKVFDGTDFLNETHKAWEFLSKESKKKFHDLHSFADFAVFEIDFNKIKSDSLTINANNKDIRSKKKYINENNGKFAQELAKDITNNYKENTTKHIKFKKESYLKDYNKIDFPFKGALKPELDQLYAVGWPSSKGDFYLKQYVDDDQRAMQDISFSLWTNTEFEYYDINVVNGENSVVRPENLEKFKRGNFLSYQIGYRSFVNKPGVLDTFIASPKAGDDFIEINGKKYANMVLAYMPRRWAPIGGASGSSIRNQNNELVAVYYATNTSARVGMAAAFRSEGFDYEGLYGKYNLPQYDLIYGGGKDQKSSYKDALKKMYESQNGSFKTNLFKDGLDKENPEYKFDKVLTYSDINK
ncbi:Hypothetical protein, predicted lipoprotein [Metamycoplasma auris 15026]|uniref:DUF31 domain-containing protein n=1 Tax=Metamycoplasma auris 15026 TaxID=1188233 RepID=N9VAV9_9BACT|nr:lipoprotein [Metamycoplasma auris]ENY68813.1 Hypothetical protein, predicted lipoprotein [Metamycoplasma auris 15026]